MQLVDLQRRRNRKVVAVARELLDLAEAGDLQGLSFVAKLGHQDHRAGIVGDYRQDPQAAVYATLRMNRHLLDDDDQ